MTVPLPYGPAPWVASAPSVQAHEKWRRALEAARYRVILDPVDLDAHRGDHPAAPPPVPVLPPRR